MTTLVFKITLMRKLKMWVKSQGKEEKIEEIREKSGNFFIMVHVPATFQ